ncbi:MAG TPA: TlpA disulfide reductase family protein [Steroidobacteraceae bacterium]|nr:TlpA disulfide reductase family protein [Steroidobacteraceae bacterium]
MRTLVTRALPAAAVIVAAGLGGFFAYGWLARLDAPLGPPMPAAAAPPLASAGTPATQAIPDTLPDLAFADRSGVMRRLSDWKGQALLVNFWATWCGPCREETPLLERLSRERARDGLQVIGIAVDSRPAVLEYARRAAIPYPLLIGEQPGLKLIHDLGMQAVFPFSVFVDQRGEIVAVKVGVLRADQAQLILERVQELDQGHIDLPTARREIADGIAELGVARAQTHLSPRL